MLQRAFQTRPDRRGYANPKQANQLGKTAGSGGAPIVTNFHDRARFGNHRVTSEVNWNSHLQS